VKAKKPIRIVKCDGFDVLPRADVTSRTLWLSSYTNADILTEKLLEALNIPTQQRDL
jgi:hypothetical protein